ncbi:Thiol-disulfide isomerase or thioredoxin [Chitinophaga sp. CF118]|nr:Thiol-disulfide isomerase or thioredoxin [Chitinophaga sp. CF118]
MANNTHLITLIKMKAQKYFRSIILLAGCMILATMTFAQDKVTLKIGDTAPELKYAKWIKGTPVKAYKKDYLYVFEFWATWCGPCKAAMPHLSELAKKYKDKATFTGINIWEKTGDKPYESSLPSVIKFVNSVGDKMAYNVAADNNEQHMAKKWMIAAGQNGIPATFLLKDGKIIWIGHPMALDSIMEAVIDGKYDMEAYKQKFEGMTVKSEALMAKFKALEPIQKAFQAKEYDKATAMIDTSDATDPYVGMQLKALRFQILIGQKKESEALDFAANWVKENKGVGGSIAGVILGTDSLSPKTYLYAAELGKDVLNEEGVVIPLVQHFIAKAYAKAGDPKAAIIEEEKALQGAKDALKEGKFIGSILDYTVTEFEASLAAYKKEIQK